MFFKKLKLLKFIDSYYSFGTTGGIVNIGSISNLKCYLCFKYLLKNQVIDLSWASDGYTLIFCSQDGYVFFIKFSNPSKLRSY